MTAEAIKNIIKFEIESEDDSNILKTELANHLIEPELQTYRKKDLHFPLKQFWTVFEEKPDKSGYAIYFNPETALFGLAIMHEGELYDIGEYGTFIKTFYSL